MVRGLFFKSILELRNLPILRWAFLITCLSLSLLPIADASAAEVFTKNKGLNGSVVGVTAEGVEFETIYGKGTILIQWSDVESIRQERKFDDFRPQRPGLCLSALLWWGE
jgi:hypothetical protein